MPGERTSVYLTVGLAAAVKASSQPLAELIRRGLAAGTAAPPPGKNTLTTSRAPTALADGEPSPGVLCMGPGCFQRDIRKYGLRSLPLCPARAAALQGETHQRQTPQTAAHTSRRDAAA
jgi:hypothetical protein